MSWKEFMNGVANDLTNAIIRRAPFKTGTLANSIQVLKVGDEGFTITMVGYGKDVEFGTPPHIIITKYAKALHWKSGKEDVFATKVHHPGTPPNPFIRSTIHSQLRRILRDNAELHMN